MARSVARTVVDRTPVTPYGVTIAPSALLWPAKSSYDTLDYTLDLSWFLADVPGDSISAATVAIAPSATGDLQAGSATYFEGYVTTILSSGATGRLYSVKIDVTTAQNRHYERVISLPVGGVGSTLPPATGTTAGYGTAVNATLATS